VPQQEDNERIALIGSKKISVFWIQTSEARFKRVSLTAFQAYLVDQLIDSSVSIKRIQKQLHINNKSLRRYRDWDISQRPSYSSRDAKCKNCKKIFKVKSGRKGDYCSRECSYSDAKNWPQNVQRRSNKIKKAPQSRVYFNACRICKMEFPTNSRKNYCVEHNPSRAKRTKDQPCICCGKPMAPKKAKFCSAECRHLYGKKNPENSRAWHEWFRSGDKEGFCVCGKQFAKRNPEQMFCSEKCQQRTYSVIHKNNLLSFTEAKRMGMLDVYKQFFELRKEIQNVRQKESRSR
jgi:predicted nucleic acid-binding Zn ribbon protein